MYRLLLFFTPILHLVSFLYVEKSFLLQSSKCILRFLNCSFGFSFSTFKKLGYTFTG